MKLACLLILLIVTGCASKNELERLNNLNIKLENSIKKTTNKAASNKLKAIKKQIQYKINNFNK